MKTGRWWCWVLVAAGIAGAGPWAKVRADEPRRSVFKIFASKSPPNYLTPWEVSPPTESTGSGVLIEGGRILTNAHVVRDAQQVYVQPYESADKLDATIEFISQDCDLATLTVDEGEEIAELKPVPLADALPALKTKVHVLGYPTGGDTLSVTEGVVSRIECVQYYYWVPLLRIQVDAAINPGNSGGPAIVDGRITGIVFSRLSAADNIGYLIPAEVIRHFLEDCIADGRYDGFPMVDLACATLENPSLRQYLKLSRQETGVVIHRVNDPRLRTLLRPWDVILSCDGVNIDNLGMVPVTEGVRVHWAYLLSRKPAGSTVRLGLFREGQHLEVEIPTVTRLDTVIQANPYPRPSYFIYGGLVFSPATTELVYTGATRWLPYVALRGRLLARAIGQYRQSPDEELVVTPCKILPHSKVNKGYEVTPLSVLTHVNDVPVRNLRHLIGLLRDNREPFVIFRFEDDYEEKVVLDPADVAQHQADILRQNNIPSPCSEDLRDLCDQGPAR